MNAGVQFVAGTDAGWRFTRIDDLPLEIEMMYEGGMTSMEALMAATGYAADVIGIGESAGRLNRGCPPMSW